MKTDEEGFAYNQFWVTDRAGNSLKRSAAELTAERMGDFITYCTPSRKVPHPFLHPLITPTALQRSKICCKFTSIVRKPGAP